MRARLPHVGALDGLRAVSLIAVLCYHGGFGWAQGGFLGVSTFFTLSGFLITSILLVENHSTGTVSLKRFWTARARRLMPAALVALVLILAFAHFAASPTQLTGLRGDLFSVFGLVTNWRLAFGGRAYGAYLATSSPVQHIWSLAVEEQFYLCLPLVVAVVTRRSARPQRPLAIIAGVLALASTGALVTAVRSDGSTNWAYYATHTRAAELLAGVFLACTVHQLARFKHRALIVNIAGVVGAIVTVGAWAVADQASPRLYQGGLSLYTLASVSLIVASLQKGPVRAVLERPSLQWLGRISYGAYLYHWPLFLWITADRIGFGGVPLFAVRVGMTLILATLSAAIIEVPIRSRRVLPRLNPIPVFAVVIVGLLLVTTVPARSVDTGPSGVEVAAGHRVVAPDAKGEPLGGSRGLRSPSSRPGTTTTTSTTTPPEQQLKRMLIVGDSITRQVAPYFAQAFPKVDVRWVGADGIGLLTRQGEVVDMVREAIKTVDPDVVLVEFAGSYVRKRGGPFFLTADGAKVHEGTDLLFQTWAQQAHKLVDIARSRGAMVLWALAPPVDPNGYFGYLAPNVDRYNAIYRALPEVDVIDWFDEVSAPGGGFAAQLVNAKGQPETIRSVDGLHFTDLGYRRLVALTAGEVVAYHGREFGPATRKPD